MKTDRLKIRGEFLDKEDKPYRSITGERINYTSDYVKWLEDKLVNTINYTNCCETGKIKNMKWWQKKVKGWIVPFWYTDTPLYSKRAVEYGLDKLAEQVRKNRRK